MPNNQRRKNQKRKGSSRNSDARYFPKKKTPVELLIACGYKKTRFGDSWYKPLDIYKRRSKFRAHAYDRGNHVYMHIDHFPKKDTNNTQHFSSRNPLLLKKAVRELREFDN